MSRLPVPRSIVWSIAFTGVFVGHALTYAILAPLAQTRSQHAGLVSTVVGLATAFLGRLGRGRGASEMAFRALASRVVSFQFLAFAAIEVAERSAARAPLHDLTHVLPVGAVAQLAVGVLMAIVIKLVLRAADAAAGILGPASPTPRRSVPVLLSLRAGVPAFTDRLVLGERGPPR